MDQSQDYVIHSLEQHLFFARIMKEHARAIFNPDGFFRPGLRAGSKISPLSYAE